MKIPKEQLSGLSIIIGFISSIIALLKIIYDSYDMIFLTSIILIFMSNILFCIYWLNRYPILKRYRFIRYLFFETKENKFNIAPKILLYFDIKNKRNGFAIKTLTIQYNLVKSDVSNRLFDSHITYYLKDISKVKTNNFYIYTGIDLGTIKNQEFAIINNGKKETVELLPDNISNSKNEVFMYHWNIPKRSIKNGEKLDAIMLSMDQVESFNFENKEVINFFPWNFAKEIEEVNFEISYPLSLGKLSMQLFEVGKIKNEKFPFHHPLETTTNEEYIEDKDNKTVKFSFSVKKEELNIDNLYYIILHKR